MDITAADVERWTALVDGVTPGEWVIRRNTFMGIGYDICVEVDGNTVYIANAIRGRAEAELFVAAPTIVRALLAERQRVTVDDAALGELRDELRRAKGAEKLADQMAAIHEEARWQEKQNAMLLYKALARHAPDALAEVESQLYQSTNEYDKVRSDMVRTVERLEREVAALREKVERPY